MPVTSLKFAKNWTDFIIAQCWSFNLSWSKLVSQCRNWTSSLSLSHQLQPSLLKIILYIIKHVKKIILIYRIFKRPWKIKTVRRVGKVFIVRSQTPSFCLDYSTLRHMSLNLFLFFLKFVTFNYPLKIFIVKFIWNKVFGQTGQWKGLKIF